MEKLNLPRLGYGTWQLKRDDCVQGVSHALEVGYRHIDTAQAYGNEAEVGDVLAAEIVDREEIVLATKIFFTNFSPQRMRKTFLKSLKKLQTDYVDLLYLHWPAKIFYKPQKTLPALDKLVDEGLVKHIGLSNFTPTLLDEAAEILTNPIGAVQVEHHPFLPQEVLREYLDARNIALVAYSPLARGKVLGHSVLKEIAAAHNVSEVEISLAWLMHHGAVPIPKATSQKHIESNYKALDINLTPEQVEKIDNLDKRKRYLNPPFIRPKW